MMAQGAVDDIPAPIKVRTRVERHDPQLPCYVVVLARALAKWRLAGTLVVVARFNGSEPYRRTLKRWDAERWYIELPMRLLLRGHLSEGSTVLLELEPADTTLPVELTAYLSTNIAARTCWERLSPSRQRVVAEHVREGRTSATRAARVKRWFDAQGMA